MRACKLEFWEKKNFLETMMDVALPLDSSITSHKFKTHATWECTWPLHAMRNAEAAAFFPFSNQFIGVCRIKRSRVERRTESSWWCTIGGTKLPAILQRTTAATTMKAIYSHACSRGANADYDFPIQTINLERTQRLYGKVTTSDKMAQWHGPCLCHKE